jgi:hypothetical protein
MPFGIGFGELVMILILVVVYVFGAKDLPSLRERLIPIRLRERPEPSRQWTQSEWLLFVAAVVLTAIGLGNAVMATAPRR